MNLYNPPNWARENDSTMLQFLCNMAALQFSPSGGFNLWAEKAGVSSRVIYVSINRGKFSPSSAQKLAEAIPGGAIKFYWLISPASALADLGGADNG